MLKRDKRDIVRRFRELAPDHPSISVQRWSARRAGLWLACLLGAFLAVSMAVGNLPGAGLVTPQHSSEAGLAAVVRAPECGRVDDSIILEAQSVPSAASIPCVKGLPVGWRFRTMTVEASTSKLFFAYDRPNAQEVVATFTKSCLLRAATEVQTDKPGTTRFEEVRALGNRYVGSRFYVFEGGCLEIAFDFRGTIPTVLADEVSSGIDLTPRSAVVEDLRKAGISL